MRLFVAVAAFAAMTSYVVTAQGDGEENPQQPTKGTADDVTMKQTTNLGCFSNPGDMWDMGPYTFQSTGWCQALCVRQEATYFAMVNGTNCFCGKSPPKSDDKVKDSECNVSCNGIDTQMCGGTNMWRVYADNFRNGDKTGTVHITTPTQTWFGHEATGGSDSDSTDSSKKAKPTHNDNSQDDQQQGVNTVVITASGKAIQTVIASSSTPSAGSGSGPNKAGIAAGVVVGVLALAAIIGGTIFFIRRKKQKALDDERRRHEAMTNFVARGEKPPSTFSGSDSRLEPSVMFQRRQSDGSIADNQDYSRRILKVTNPDDR